MPGYCIRKARIHVLRLPKGYDGAKVRIGIPVEGDEPARIGLKDIGDAVLPSAEFGPVCAKNAHGYSYPDRTKEREYRYVSTVWMRPYGNEDAYPIAIDNYRYCYPRVDVAPTEIELVLAADDGGARYVVADLNGETGIDRLTAAVNLFLEIYGYCYLYRDTLEAVDLSIRRRCHWKILPPGERPSEHLRRELAERGMDTDTFDAARLEYVEQYGAEKIVEGINGFNGYYAYVFKTTCVLESAAYGNATYIIPKENWEMLSQRTKRELLDGQLVKQKIVHTCTWYETFGDAMSKYEGK